MISRPEHDIDPAELSDSSRRELLDRHHIQTYADCMDPLDKCMDDQYGPEIGVLHGPGGESVTVVVAYTRKPAPRVRINAPTWSLTRSVNEWETHFQDRFNHQPHRGRAYVRAALEGEYDVLCKQLDVTPLSYAAAMYDDVRRSQYAQKGLNGATVV